MGDPTPNDELLAAMTAQHDALRDKLTRCAEAADEVERSQSADGEPLIASAKLLLEALVEHNQVEEERLAPVLVEADAFGDVHLREMAERHRAEHAALVSTLSRLVLVDDARDAIKAVRAAVDDIRQQIDAEEEQYLNDRVVRDDVVSVDPFGG